MIHFDKEWTVKHRNKIKQEGRTVTAANKGLNCVMTCLIRVLPASLYKTRHLPSVSFIFYFQEISVMFRKPIRNRQTTVFMLRLQCCNVPQTQNSQSVQTKYLQSGFEPIPNLCSFGSLEPIQSLQFGFSQVPPFCMATIRTSSLCCSRCLQLCSCCSLLQMDREAWVYSQKRLFAFALDSPSWWYFDFLDFGHKTPLHHHFFFINAQS